jgi:hypothetical protein
MRNGCDSADVDAFPGAVASPTRKRPPTLGNMLQMQKIEDSGQLRWRWLTGMPVKFRAGVPLEMLNIKVEPTMCMKTKKTMTKCHAKESVFCGKKHPNAPSLQNSATIGGFFLGKCSLKTQLRRGRPEVTTVEPRVVSVHEAALRPYRCIKSHVVRNNSDTLSRQRHRE